MIVELICPGLLDPMELPPGLEPRTPRLNRLLARADVEASQPRDPLQHLAARFGVEVPPGTDLPSAPLCLLADAPDQGPSGFWLHADPVHLRADRDRLLLFAGPSLQLTATEAAALATAFNTHFDSDGLHLLVTESGRWYLRTSRAARLATHPVHRVAGRPVDAFMPTGSDANDWNRWLNEAQMLFFSDSVNQARENRGVPGIGGIWPWGGGELPRVEQGPDLVVCEHPLGLGLARAAGVPVCSVAELVGTPDAISSLGSVLVFWDRSWWPALAGDVDAWIGAAEALEPLVASLLDAVMDGRVRALVLDDGASLRLEATRGRMRRFWRRGPGLAGRLRGC